MVTGGAGFIGSHLVDRLLSEGHQVICFENLDDYYSGKEKNIEHNLGDSGFEFHEKSILDYDVLRSSLDGVDVVFHEAAQPGVRVSIRDPFKTHSTNVDGTLNVLLASSDSDVKKIIYASSSSVYGNDVTRPTRENCGTRPISPYGVSKLVTEHYCRVFGELYGLKIVTLRYFTVFGPRQRPDMAIRKFVHLMSSGKPARIFGNGEQTRDFTYISDIVDANMLAMKSNGADGEVLNIGGGSSVSVNEVVSRIGEYFPDSPPPVYQGIQEGDVDHTLSDNSKARELLGWKPKTSFDEGLKKSIDWFLSNAHYP
ncbi:MAG: NAD-dependent epimerase/dehydratase family protein [Methanomassiliicoccales archaeon]|nr:MAG: NAD-dependent epimerase/dehydratase family protein [Methanomassiliicoccales archaeon]